MSSDTHSKPKNAEEYLGLPTREEKLKIQERDIVEGIYRLHKKHGFEHPLQEVFDLCLDQLTKGKGEERHGQGKDFMDQPWKSLADTHGFGFLSGQAAKKLEEAQSFEEVDRWEREMIGVIVYAAMAIMHRKLESDLG